MRSFGRGLAAAALVTIAVVAPAARADAHAVLQSSDPAERQVLASAPERVVLKFSERVTINDSSVRVLDDRGVPLVAKGVRHLDGQDDTVVLALPDLEDDAYVVTWRVISADSHPAAGAYTFRVGTGRTDFHVGASLLEADRGSRSVGVLFGVVRFAVFSSLIALTGGLAFLLLLWPAGLDRPRPRRFLRVAWWTALVGTGAAILLQGPYGQGQGLGAAFSPSTVSSVLRTRFGQAGLIRLALLALLWLLAMRPGRAVPVDVAVAVAEGGSRPRGRRRDTIGLLLVAVLATVAAAGHAVSGKLVALAIPADVIHLVGLGLWLGGLAMVVVYLIDGEAPTEMARVLPRFSTLAFGSVVAIVATGTFQSWRQLDGIGHLTNTTFGRLLLAKLVLVGVLVGIGGLSRRSLRVHDRRPPVPVSVGPGAVAADNDRDLARRLRRSVGAEVVLALAVLSVTAVLVNSVPGRTAAESIEAIPFSTELTEGEVKVVVSVDPARAGLNDIHIYTSSLAGRPTDPLEVNVTLSLASGGASNIKVPLVKTGTGHYSAFGFPIPIPGTWKVDVGVLVSEFDEVRVSASVPIA